MLYEPSMLSPAHALAVDCDVGVRSFLLLLLFPTHGSEIHRWQTSSSVDEPSSADEPSCVFCDSSILGTLGSPRAHWHTEEYHVVRSHAGHAFAAAFAAASAASSSTATAADAPAAAE